MKKIPVNPEFDPIRLKAIFKNVCQFNRVILSDIEHIDDLVFTILGERSILKRFQEECGYLRYEDYIEERKTLDILSSDREWIVNVIVIGIIRGSVSFLLDYYKEKY
jgi:hypothetical protein